jgi:hypothetical protein
MGRERLPGLLVALLLLLSACRGTLELRVEGTPGPAMGPTPVETMGRPSLTIQPTPGQTVSWPVDGSALLYRVGEALYRLDRQGQRAIGNLDDGAHTLRLSTRYLAYVCDNELCILHLTDGVGRTLVDLGDHAAQSLDLCWADDGSAVAYTVAWDEADGSRQVRLGTTDGYEHRTVAEIVARPPGPTPTPRSEPPPLLQYPGFTHLGLLAFQRSLGQVAVVPWGGEEGLSAVWLYDVRARERMLTVPLPAGISEMTASPDLRRLAYARYDPSRGEGECIVYDLDRGAVEAEVALPGGTHAACLHWSPRGQRLAYVLREGSEPGLAITPTLALYVLESGQAELLPLVVSPEAMLHGWTPDGEALLVEALDALGRARVLQLIEGATHQVTRVTIPTGAQVLGVVETAPKPEADL